MIIGVRGKAPEVRKTTDGGCKPPGQGYRTIVSPKGATEYLTCLITTCLVLCRPLGASFVVALLPGLAPPSVVSRPFGTLE